MSLPVVQVKRQNFLGPSFTEGLTCTVRVRNLVSHVSRTAVCIYRATTLIPNSLKLPLLFVIVSKFLYGSLVRGITFLLAKDALELRSAVPWLIYVVGSPAI